MPSLDNKEDHERFMRTCRFCPAPRVPDIELPFCKDHYAQYRLRQEVKVPTDSLDTGWLDSLSTWRNAPPQLANEPFAERLRFWDRRGDRLLFWMSFSSRLPDCLEVNIRTGATRRLVEVGLQDAESILDGKKSAPSQLGRELRWGHERSWLVSSGRHPAAWYTYIKRLLMHGQTMISPVCTAPFPIYGLRESGIGLELHHVSVLSTRNQPLQVWLYFAWPHPAYSKLRAKERPAILCVGSSIALADGSYTTAKAHYGTPITKTGFSKDLALEKGLAGIWRLAGSVTEGDCNTLLAKRKGSIMEIHQGFLNVDAKVFGGTVLHWVSDQRSSVFSLKQIDSQTNVANVIEGWSHNIPIHLLLEELKSLTAINDDFAVVARYEKEWRANRGSLFQADTST